MNLKFHHLGVLTASLESSIEDYTSTLGAELEAGPATIVSQQTEVALLQLPGGIRVELVMPLEGAGSLRRMLDSGITYYHVGYEVADIECSAQQLTEGGYHALAEFASELLEGRKCRFLIGPDQNMIELIETEGSP